MDRAKKAKPEILIVDDMPINIQVLANALKDEYRIKIAANGKKALRIISSGTPPDLILLDVMMPEMDGYEVCRRLKSNELTQDIPVIFVTAKDEVEDETFGFELGAADYISKPFQLAIVKARVRTHLDLKLKTDLLNELASLDGLTHIPNRRRFDEMLEKESRRAARDGSILSLLMIDVDYFKAFNDKYGHGAGDECLIQVATALQSSLKRPADLVARYGGEEFAVLLPDVAPEASCRFAESLRSKIDALNIPHLDSTVADHVTISIGCASSTPHETCLPENLLKMADAGLYRAKSEGRNRVCCAL